MIIGHNQMFDPSIITLSAAVSIQHIPKFTYLYTAIGTIVLDFLDENIASWCVKNTRSHDDKHAINKLSDDTNQTEIFEKISKENYLSDHIFDNLASH